MMSTTMANCFDKVKSIFQSYCHCCYDYLRIIIVFGILLLLTALAATPILIIRYAVIPQVKANVEDARLDTFGFATKQCQSIFSYNCSVAITIRNPNKVMRIRYTDPLVATLIFHDRRIANITVVDKGHKHGRRKRQFHPVHFTGDVPSYILGAAAAEDFKEQNRRGLFKIEVHLSGQITYREVAAIAMKRTLRISCPLNLQLAPPGPEVVEFKQVICTSIEQDNIYF